jgi:hypothetical protein
MAFATVVLAIVTWKYVRLTRDLAQAARRLIAVAEQSLRLESTPIIVWDYLRTFLNDNGRLEAEYRLRNAGSSFALNAEVALERYPVDGEPVMTYLRRTGVSLAPGGVQPADGRNHLSHVIPLRDDEREQWRHAVRNESYGLVTYYYDVLGQRWRTAMRQRTYELRVKLDETAIALRSGATPPRSAGRCTGGPPTCSKRVWRTHG